MIHFWLTHDIGQIRYICCSDKSSWWNIEKFNYKWGCSLSLMIRQFPRHCDCVYTCSNWIFSVDLELRPNPVEINHKGCQLRDRRHWITLIPVPINIIAHDWIEKKVWVIISFFRVVNDIAMIDHWIGHYSLIAA
jgi:hypothetical protein